MTDLATNPLKRSGGEPVVAPSDNKKPKAIDDPSGGGMDVDEDDDDEEDEMAGLDESNIISGARTRGKQIDFSKDIEAMGDDDDEDDTDVVVGDETIELDDDGEEESNEEDESEEADA